MAHGFEESSFNRIIEAAGVSKGAMYYYFDDKADLYGTVVRRAAADFEAFLAQAGPPPEVTDPASFWATIHWLSMQTFAFSAVQPESLELVKPLYALPMTAQGLPELSSQPWLAPLQQLMTRMVDEIRTFLVTGQEVGAVRDDLPMELIFDSLMAVGTTLDRWALNHMDQVLRDPARFTALSLDLLRRVVAPADALSTPLVLPLPGTE